MPGLGYVKDKEVNRAQFWLMSLHPLYSNILDISLIFQSGPAGPGFVNWDRGRDISTFGPTNETGTVPYLVPGLSKVLGIFHWSHK